MVRVAFAALVLTVLAACGGGSDGIDENGQCRSEGKVQAASVCGGDKTPTPPAPINCQADRTCL